MGEEMKQPIFVITKSAFLEAMEICRERYISPHEWGALCDADSVQEYLIQKAFHSPDRARINFLMEPIGDIRRHMLVPGTDSALNRLVRLISEKKEVE